MIWLGLIGRMGRYPTSEDESGQTSQLLDRERYGIETTSEYFSERKIYARCACQRMLPIL
jgi:hypothetical protein